jgi:2-C-methyl-D-erythritol 4-phosphate cytidylyltransferase
LTEAATARFGCIAIVPSGGSGSRFGAAVPKQYSMIAGRKVIEHTLAALLTCPEIEHVVVNVQHDDAHIEDTATATEFASVTFLRSAGATRAETVQNALAAISKRVKRDAWVLVHDAARPCVLASDVARLFALAGAHSVGGLLASPVTDTLKRATRENEVAETVPRADMWRAQTPQMFRYETLVHALSCSPDVTDEGQAIEALGMSPLIVEGSARNIKITQPEDAALAAFYLSHSSPDKA